MAYLDQKPIAQGEIEFFAVTPDHFDGATVEAAKPERGVYILAHSESGHHHVIEAERAEVSTVRDSAGMTVLRLIVTDPDAVVINQNPTGHKPLALPPGVYEARISRELGLDDIVRQSRD